MPTVAITTTLLGTTSTAGFVVSNGADGSALADGTAYSLDVSANTAGGEGAKTGDVTCTPTGSVMTDFTATAESTSEIDLNWVVPSGSTAPGGYEIEEATDGVTFASLTFSGSSLSSTTDTTSGDTTYTYVVSGLQDGTTNTFRLGGFNTPATYATSFTAPASDTTDYAITNLVATPNTTQSISLTFSTPTDVTVLSVYRSIDGGPYDFLTDSAVSSSFTSTGGAFTGFTDNTVTEGHDYSYQLQGSTSSGLTQVSATADASTYAAQNLSYTPGTATMAITWTNLALADGDTLPTIQIGRSLDGVSYTWTTPTTLTSYNDTGLADDTEYFYQVKVTDGSTVMYSEPLDTWTLPPAPTGLSVSVTGGAVTLSWTNESSDSPMLDIQSSTDDVNFQTIAQVDGDTTTYEDDAAAEGTSYYQVGAENGDGTADNFSTAVTAQTPLLSPSDLTAQAISASEIDLDWVNNSTAATGITIYRSSDGGATYAALPAISDPSTNSYADTGLSAGTSYYYEVVATQGSLTSAIDETAADTTTPPAPTGLTTTAASSSQINLSWTAAPGALGYDIQRQATGGSWMDIGTTTAHIYTDTGLFDDTAYSYQVAAYNDSGQSDFSESSSATTSKEAPASPSVVAVNLSPSSNEVVWTNNAHNEDGFAIERSSDGGTTWSSPIGTTDPGDNYFIDTTASSGTAYEYRVGATLSGLDDGWSAGVSPTSYSNCTGIESVFVSDAVVLNAIESGPDGNPIDGYIAFNRQGSTADDVNVSYSVDTSAANAATPGYEYDTLSGTITIPAGATTKLLPITPKEIDQVESTKTVTVDVESGTGYSGSGSASAGITNTDDDSITVASQELQAGALANIAVQVLNHWSRPVAATLEIATSNSSVLQPQTETVTTAGDGRAAISVLAASAGSSDLTATVTSGSSGSGTEVASVDTPSTPSGLTVRTDPQNRSLVDIYWSMQRYGQTSFVVEKSTDGGETWSDLDTVSATKASCTDTVPDSLTPPQYRVIAVAAPPATAPAGTQPATSQPSPPVPGPNELIVHYWAPHINLRLGVANAFAVGHVAITLSDGTYISWFPSTKSLASPAIPKDTFARDDSVEGIAVENFYISGLDQARILAWWNQFRLANTFWKYPAGPDCATVVEDALAAGGAPLPPKPDFNTPITLLPKLRWLQQFTSEANGAGT